MKHFKTALFCIALFFAVAGVAVASDLSNVWYEEQMVRALVLNVEEDAQGQEVYKPGQLVTVEILGGSFRGQVVTLPHVVLDQAGYDIVVQPGDEVVVLIYADGEEIKTVYIADYARDTQLYYLLGAFILSLLVLGGFKGIRSIIALLITGGTILWVLLPLMMKGYDPILITVVVCTCVTAVSLILVGGVGAKTLAAIIGTAGGVIVAGVLAFLVGTAAHLTGFVSEEMYMLHFIQQDIKFDIRGILFAGMIIGALGAMMDVGMSVASAIEEIKKANPRMRTMGLVRAGMNVGRDIMCTMSHTLILAYTGSAVPLLLVFMTYNTPYLKIINLDIIATEVVRALTGSIGLCLAIPITAVAAALLMGRRSSRTNESSVYWRRA